MNWKRSARWASAFVLLLGLAGYYRAEVAAGYRAAYPSNPLQAHALADCARMNSQFNRFWTSDRTTCYEGQRIAH